MIFRLLSALSFCILTVLATSRCDYKSEERFADGSRHFALAGHPTKAPLVNVYGRKEATMNWAEGAAAVVEAKHFQQALKARF
jgi:hypothetical protein